jgi:molybdate transport system ATP-binding protein
MRNQMSITLHAVSVRRGDTWALQDVSLDLKAGERWALIGGNGAGKTQLLKLLATDVWPTPTGREARSYRAGGREIDLIAAKQRIAYVGAELQDKYARYDWNPTVADLLATGLHRSDLLRRPVTAAEQRGIASMLTLCRLTALKGRRFLSLSYGQKRIALLARALVQKPAWLLLDEFYNGLDTAHRARIDGILQHARRSGQAWVVSAHRAADVPRGTEGLIELRTGKVHAVSRLRGTDLERLVAEAEEGSPGHSARQAPRSLRSAVPPNAAQSKAARSKASQSKAAASKGRRLVTIADATLFVEYRVVLQEVNWELRTGQHWAVFGANGAGKSSFLKLLYGDLSPALGGKIGRVGFPRGTPISEWKRQVGLVSPELQTDYAVNVTVLDLVASGRYASIGLSDAPTATDLAAARRWLKFFSLLTLAKRRPRELSYGQLRRALFARAMAADPRILLLDEPLTGLDPRQRAAMKRLLERLMRQRRTLIIAVHHPEDLPQGMTHVLRLHQRRAASTMIL